MSGSPYLGWHFIALTGMTADNQPPDNLPPAEVFPGVALRIDGPTRFGEYGLHASRFPIDALTGASGPLVCRVSLGGEIDDSETTHGTFKSCATERTVLWTADADQVLREFACFAEERALLQEKEHGRESSGFSQDTVDTMRAWLRGEFANEPTRQHWEQVKGMMEAVTAAAVATAWASYYSREDEIGKAEYALLNAELERMLFTLAPEGSIE